MGDFFRVLTDNWDIFSQGFVATVKLFAIAGTGSLVLGTLLAGMRVSPIPALRAFGATYVQIIRNTPLTLIFAFLVFAVPKLEVNISFFASATVALLVYTSAFVCEVVRSGINTVQPGQAEAARAIGMNFTQVLGRVVLPQAFRAIVPPLMSVQIALLKNTTVAAGFSVLEAGAITAYLSERGEPQTSTLIWITIGFLVLVLPLIVAQRAIERRWRASR
ncbi:MAG: glutamate transport system permease protein [Actinomycetota bacterium]|jgi:glutamate transport system permease protein|nr:glutamate transport system permease protein [Actinomycetota bacterium]